MAMESYNKAIEDYSKVLELDSINIMAYHNRAETYTKKDDLEKALTDYNKILLLDSANIANIYIKRAALFEQKKSYDKAIDDYEKVIGLTPSDKLSHYEDSILLKIKELKPLVEEKHLD